MSGKIQLQSIHNISSAWIYEAIFISHKLFSSKQTFSSDDKSEIVGHTAAKLQHHTPDAIFILLHCTQTGHYPRGVK